MAQGTVQIPPIAPTIGPTPPATAVRVPDSPVPDDIDRVINEVTQELSAELAGRQAQRLGAPGPANEREGDSFLRQLVVGGSGVVGGALGLGAGSAAGGIGAVPGAMVGAGTFVAGADALMDMLEGVHRSPGAALLRSGEQATTGALSEGIGSGLHRPLGAMARWLGLSRLLSPEAAAIKSAAQQLEIPMRAGDVTGSQNIRRIENIPEYFAVGSQPTARFAQAQIEAAEQATRKAVAEFGQNLGPIQSGLKIRGDLSGQLMAFRLEADALFKAVEHAIGDAPVIPTARLRSVLNPMVEAAQNTPLGPPRGSARLGELVNPPATVQVGGMNIPTSSLPPSIQAALQQDFIPYTLARQIESELGQLAKHKLAIGDIQHGQFAALRKAIRDGIAEFLASPSQGANKAQLDQAKQVWRIEKAKFNDTILSKLMDSKLPPERVVKELFGKGPTAILDAREAVSDGTWKLAQASWLGQMFKEATVETAPGKTMFSPAKFVRALDKYIKDGSIDYIIAPESRQRLLTLVDVLRRTERAEGIATGRVAGALLATGQLTDLARSVARIGASTALGTTGNLLGGTYGGALAVGLPYGVSKLTTSQRGIDFLLTGLKGRFAPEIVNLVVQMLGQEALSETQPVFPPGGPAMLAPPRSPASPALLAPGMNR